MFALASSPEALVPNKRNLSASICLLKNSPLDTFKQSREVKQNAHEAIAASCKEFGTIDRPGYFPAPTGAVMLPIIEVRTETEEPKIPVITCVTCVNFIPENVVASEFGWSAGLCAATGSLITSNKTASAAVGCDFSKAGSNPTTVSKNVSLIRERGLIFDIYGERYGLVDQVAAVLKAISLVSPGDFDSDFPVSAEDAASGIKAWRKIPSPDIRNRHTVLPIYSDEIDENLQALIPRSGDDEHPELYVDHFGGTYATAVAWNELGETPVAWGVAGVGKTELYRHLAWLMQLPFTRISITGSTEIDDLVGKMTFVEGETRFQYGRLPQAWKRPGVVVIDEPNTGPPEVWQFLRPLTDNSKQLVIDQNAGEIIPRHQDAYLGMAMNPAWDARNVGAQEIGDADTNRLFHISVPLPPEQIEKKIIKDRVALDGVEVDEDVLNSVMLAARDIRELSSDGTIQASWGIRPQIKVARALAWFTPLQAYRRAVSDFLDPQQQEAIAEVVRANFR